MTRHAHSAGPRTRLMAMAGKVIAFVYPKTSKASCTPATNATPWLRPAGVSLQVRAHRIHNRNAKAAAIYVDLHQRMQVHLSRTKGACSDDQTAK